MIPAVVIQTGVGCVMVPGWAVVTVAGLLAGPAAVRAWVRPGGRG